MKIIALLETVPTAGGAFNQGLNAIAQMARISKENFDFEVFSTFPENLPVLEKMGIPATFVQISRTDRFIAWAAKTSFGLRLIARFKLCGPFEKKVIERKGDLVYFLTQSTASEWLQKTNFITTVFDLCHRDSPEFPEVRSFGIFQQREDHFKKNLQMAVIVVTESEALSASIQRRYGADLDRFVSLPMSASPFLDHEDASNMSDVMETYALEPGYFFYPAQFWAHKNHVRVVEALALLRDSGTLCRAVFVGSDKGNREFIRNLVKRYSLDEQVKFLGFVPSADMRGLYEGCVAVVMPTYFGPTNLPPLEAWGAGKPLLYSAHLNEHAGGAALMFDPDSHVELADAMRQCMKPEVAAMLVERGRARLRDLDSLREQQEAALFKKLLQFKSRRQCWA